MTVGDGCSCADRGRFAGGPCFPTDAGRAPCLCRPSWWCGTPAAPFPARGGTFPGPPRPAAWWRPGGWWLCWRGQGRAVGGFNWGLAERGDRGWSSRFCHTQGSTTTPKKRSQPLPNAAATQPNPTQPNPTNPTTPRTHDAVPRCHGSKSAAHGAPQPRRPGPTCTIMARVLVSMLLYCGACSSPSAARSDCRSTSSRPLAMSCRLCCSARCRWRPSYWRVSEGWSPICGWGGEGVGWGDSLGA